jgi:Zn-dependent protease
VPPPPSSRNSVVPEQPDEPSHFSLFGIPVRIGLGFWLMSFVFGFRSDRPFAAGVRSALAWTAIVFVSILLHEMGHALVARRFGAKPSIKLHAFGGLTFTGVNMSRPRQIAVSLAGPFMGFAFGALVFFLSRKLGIAPNQKWLVDQILWVNVGWGIINLIPVVPLDGGHVLAALLGPRNVFATWVISAAFAAGVAFLGLKIHSPFMMVLFGFAAIHAIGNARTAYAGTVDRRSGLEDQLNKARAALDRGDVDDAWLLADDVVRRARTQAMKNGGWTAVAWVHVQRGDGLRARQALANVDPPFAVDPYTIAAVEDAAGDATRARNLLEEARKQGFRTPESSKLLIDLSARDGRLERAVDLALEDAHILNPDDVRAVQKAALEHGAPRGAAKLAARLFELHGSADDAVAEARSLLAAGDVESALAAIVHAVQVGADRLAIRGEFTALAGDERFEKILA